MTPERHRLLVILPAYDESKTVGDVIGAIPKHIEGIDEISVLVVDDGSTDSTVEVARAAGAQVISHGTNLGVGAAMITGLREALDQQVDFAVNIDADGQFNPLDIVTLLRPLLSGEAEFATASRFADRALVPRMPVAKRFGNAVMSWLASSITRRKFYDVSCGFRAYTRESLMRLFLHGRFTYTQEMILALCFAGVRVVEVPIKVRGVREHGRSRVAGNLFAYGVKALGILFSSVRDYRPGLFFNSVAAALFLISLGLTTFFLWHRITTGVFSPHLWAGFSGAFMFWLGVTAFLMGQVAMMLSRQRLLQEEQLYISRKSLLRRGEVGAEPGDRT